MPPEAGKTEKCIVLLIVAALLFLGSSFLCAQTNSANTAPYTHRWLLVVENSRAMQRRADGVLQSIQAVLGRDFGGQLRTSDAVGVWAFNDGVTRARPFEVWSLTNRAGLNSSVTSFVQGLKYENQASLDKILPELHRLFQEPGLTTAVLITSGDGEITGTPFDQPVNSSHQQWRDPQQKSRMPIVTLLRGGNGHVLSWAVCPAPWPLELPPLPAALPAARTGPAVSLTSVAAFTNRVAFAQTNRAAAPQTINTQAANPKFAELPTSPVRTGSNVSANGVNLPTATASTNNASLTTNVSLEIQGPPDPTPLPSPPPLLVENAARPSTDPPVEASLPSVSVSPQEPAIARAIPTNSTAPDPPPLVPSPATVSEHTDTSASAPGSTNGAAAKPASQKPADILKPTRPEEEPTNVPPPPDAIDSPVVARAPISAAKPPHPSESFVIQNAPWLAIFLVGILGAGFCFLSYIRSSARPPRKRQPVPPVAAPPPPAAGAIPAAGTPPEPPKQAPPPHSSVQSDAPKPVQQKGP